MVNIVDSVPKPIQWTLLSSTELQDGSIISEFDAPTSIKGYRYHLAKTVTPHGDYGHYSVI